MYSFVEADDRVTTVLEYIDAALKDLDEMDGQVTSYKIHLNVGSLSTLIDAGLTVS